MPAPVTFNPGGRAVQAVHYYLGRPARVWMAATSSASRRGQRARTAGSPTATSPPSPQPARPQEPASTA